MGMENRSAVGISKARIGVSTLSNVATQSEKPASQIEQELSNMEAVLGDIYHLAVSLEKALSPVLTSCAPDGESQAGELAPGRAPLADKLWEQYRKAAQTRDRLQDMLQRVAL
jgi:hypothetical protein